MKIIIIQMSKKKSKLFHITCLPFGRFVLRRCHRDFDSKELEEILGSQLFDLAFSFPLDW